MRPSLQTQDRNVKLSEDNAFVQTDAENAIAVAVRGELYNINGKEEVPDRPSAIIKETDGATFVFEQSLKLSAAEDTMNGRFISAEEAMCEIDLNTDNRMTAIEEAMCEMDLAMSELSNS